LTAAAVASGEEVLNLVDYGSQMRQDISDTPTAWHRSLQALSFGSQKMKGILLDDT
jgi:hypothetical protein